MEEKENLKKKYIINPNEAFVKYMKKTIKSKKMSKRDVFYFADIPIGYGYKLLLGEKRTKQRDIIIRICLMSRFTVTELQETLKLYEMPILYKKILRDEIILQAFRSRNYNIDLLNDNLKRNSLQILKSCGEE